MLSYIVPALTVALQLCIVCMMLRSGEYRRFPWLFALVTFQLGETISRAVLLAGGTSRLYFWFSWVTEILDVTLALSAFRESFRHVFPNFGALYWSKRIFWGFLVLTCTYWMWEIVTRAVRNPTAWFVPILIQADILTANVIVVLGILYSALTRYYEIEDDRREKNIIAGLGIAASGSLLFMGWRWIFGTRMVDIVSWIVPLAYVVGATVWLLEFRRPRPPAPRKLNSSPEDMLKVFRAYNAVLQRGSRKRN
ncbi:MAG TPA: hypothetical protein VFK06_24555 [Candidatus Angelobacter sp.]|nr:hypothetical protein [Candidatus Angelobacter sp.]